MLTGNTQFNKAALDRDRNVISYVRGDTKSEGKNRFIREGEVICYIAMEFWSPVEKQYLVTGVCIEYVNETSNTKKWFVFKDTKIEECVFYTEEEKKITVYPRYRLMVKGKKIPAGEFMNRDRGTEQVLRALGLRCGVDKYRAKLVKMMAFNPENNIDKFIQECVLDEHLVRSMEDIREHRKHYDDAKMVYEELSNGKRQLEIVQQKIADYEGAERKYEIRRILLLYQEMKSYQENLEELQCRINVNKAKISQLQNQLEEQREKRSKALERKVDAQRNHLLSDADKVMKSIEENIRSMEKEKENVENERKIFDALRAMEPVGTMKVKVSRNPGKKEPERIAVMEYQFGGFQLKKPAIRREKELLESLTVNAIFVHERRENAGKEEELHWFLLTTKKINSQKDAERIIQDYIAGWKIECFHHILKSGCKIEEKHARSYSNLAILTLLYSVIALIILCLTYMGRVYPNLPAKLVFTKEECHVLYHAANKTRSELKQNYTICEAVNDLAVSGGRKGAPSDGLIGVNSIWKGLCRLGILLEYAAFML